MKQEDCCILLTATVTPNASRCTGDVGMLTDPTIRHQQYVDALRWYLDNTKAKIVFAENSGAYDIIEEFANYGRGGYSRVEFVIWKEKPELDNPNKGYKEMKILEYAWEHSKFLTQSKVIVKITGRLKCLNIAWLIRTLPDIDCYLSARVLYNRSYTDSRVFAITYNAGQLLFRYRDDILPTICFETILLRAIDNLPYGCRFVYLPLWPDISGVCGGTGHIYDTKGLHRIWAHIKHFLRRIKYRNI